MDDRTSRKGPQSASRTLWLLQSLTTALVQFVRVVRVPGTTMYHLRIRYVRTRYSAHNTQQPSYVHVAYDTSRVKRSAFHVVAGPDPKLNVCCIRGLLTVGTRGKSRRSLTPTMLYQIRLCSYYTRFSCTRPVRVVWIPHIRRVLCMCSFLVDDSVTYLRPNAGQ